MKRALRIDVVSDVVCPWCFIGTRRLAQAAERFVDVDITIGYRPFLLDASTPDEGGDLRERLQKKYGMNPERMFDRVEAAARESGIPLDFSVVRRYASTVRAHTLLRHADAKGTQRALGDALFVAYFLEGRDIGKADVLVELAGAHGFSASEARELLANPDELAETKSLARELSAQGIDGVPFTILGDRFAVPGAQPVEVFEQAIDKALSEIASEVAEA